MSPGGFGPCFSLPLWPSHHFNLPHTTRVAAVFPPSSLSSSQNTPGSAQSLSLLVIPPVNRAQAWSTSVGLAWAHSCKKPCPLGTLQRDCPSRLLAPRLLMLRASIWTLPHLTRKPQALSGISQPFSLLLAAGLLLGLTAAPASEISPEGTLPCLTSATVSSPHQCSEHTQVQTVERCGAWALGGLSIWLRERSWFCCSLPNKRDNRTCI